MQMKLQDGRMFDTVAKKIIEPEEQQASLATSFLPAPKNIKLEDLPADPRKMNVIAAILSYRLLGIPDNDICIALGCNLEQLITVTNSEAFERSYKMAIEAFVNGQQKAAKDIIHNNSIDAASEVVSIMKKSKSEQNRLKAASTILDRVGISSESSKDPMGGGLLIKIVRDAEVDNIEVKIGA